MSKKTHKTKSGGKVCISPSYGVRGTPHRLTRWRPALPVQQPQERVLATTWSWIWTLLSSINSFHAVHDFGSSYQEKFWSHLLTEKQCLRMIRSEQGSWSTLQQQREVGTEASWAAFVTHWHTKCASGTKSCIPLFHQTIFATLERAYPYSIKQSPLATSAFLIQPWRTTVFSRPWLYMAGGYQVGLAGTRAQTLHQKATEAANSGTKENRNATLSWLSIWSWLCGCVMIHS